MKGRRRQRLNEFISVFIFVESAVGLPVGLSLPLSRGRRCRLLNALFSAAHEFNADVISLDEFLDDCAETADSFESTGDFGVSVKHESRCSHDLIVEINLNLIDVAFLNFGTKRFSDGDCTAVRPILSLGILKLFASQSDLRLLLGQNFSEEDRTDAHSTDRFLLRVEFLSNEVCLVKRYEGGEYVFDLH